MAANVSLAKFVTAILFDALDAGRWANVRDVVGIREISISVVYGSDDATKPGQDIAEFDSITMAQRWLAEHDREVLADRRHLAGLPAQRLGRLSIRLRLPSATMPEQISG